MKSSLPCKRSVHEAFYYEKPPSGWTEITWKEFLKHKAINIKLTLLLALFNEDYSRFIFFFQMDGMGESCSR